MLTTMLCMNGVDTSSDSSEAARRLWVGERAVRGGGRAGEVGGVGYVARVG